MDKIYYKPEVESAMIATLLHHPHLYSTLSLKDEHFAGSLHRLAYQTIKKMHSDSEAINIVTFSGRFMDAGGKISQINALFQEEKWFSPLFASGLLKQLAEELVKRKIAARYKSLDVAPKEFIEEVKKFEMDFIDSKPKSIHDAMAEVEQNLHDREEREKATGSSQTITGFNSLDVSSIFTPGALVVLAAKTSIGKTAFAINIAYASAMFNQKTVFVSAEMTSIEVMRRIVAQSIGYSPSSPKDYKRAEAEINTMGDNFIIIDSPRITSAEVVRIINQNAKPVAPVLVVVDYIQYLRDPIEKNQTNNDRVGNITRNLKALAMELKCTVLALSQVSRQAAGEPELHHLRDSGNLEQDADAVLILHREERDSTKATLNVAKNRNGKVFKFDLQFNPSLTKFYERSF